MKKKTRTYEEAVEYLEALVARIRDGRMGLEEMRGEVKEALALIRTCREKLRGIESDMRAILENPGPDEEE